MQFWKRLWGRKGGASEVQKDETPESRQDEVSDTLKPETPEVHEDEAVETLKPEMPEVHEDERVERYKRIRETGRNLTGKIMKHLPKFVLENTAHDLKMMRGKCLIIDMEDESALLMDRCFFDVYWGEQNKNLIGHFMDSDDYQRLSEEERAIVQGMSAAYYSLFEIVSVNPLECTLEMDDLLGDKTYIITDVNLSFTSREGYLLAARIKCVDGIHMTSGAVCPFESDQTGLLLDGLRPRGAPVVGKGKKKKKHRGMQRSDYSLYFYRQYKRVGRIPFRTLKESGEDEDEDEDE